MLGLPLAPQEAGMRGKPGFVSRMAGASVAEKSAGSAALDSLQACGLFTGSESFVRCSAVFVSSGLRPDTGRMGLAPRVAAI